MTLPKAIETIRLDELKLIERNPRIHPPAQIKKIAASIKRFGWLIPLLVDEDCRIICGEARYKAALELGLEEAPVIPLGHLSEAEIRAYRIADNRLAEDAEWDPAVLRVEFECILELDNEFEIPVLGFETAEIDLILGDEVQEDDAADEPVPLEKEAVTKSGDMVLLSEHRLLCGSALEAGDYEVHLEGKSADLIFTDPPYNVPVMGHVSGLGKHSHREFAMATGEMKSSEFQAFLSNALRLMTEHSRDGSIHFICMDWRHAKELILAGEEAYSELKNICVWNKSNGGMGSLYRSKHELIFVFKHGKAPHINNIELGKHGRNRYNVWDYAGMSSFSPDRDEELALHPTVKPVAMIEEAIKDCSHRGDLVLDPFCGSGSTILAAERSGRVAFGIEIDPLYCDVAIRRWQKMTGEQAVFASSGETFDERDESRDTRSLRSESPSEEVVHV